jgi:hypothetical protein
MKEAIPRRIEGSSDDVEEKYGDRIDALPKYDDTSLAEVAILQIACVATQEVGLQVGKTYIHPSVEVVGRLEAVEGDEAILRFTESSREVVRKSVSEIADTRIYMNMLNRYAQSHPSISH